MTTGRIRVTTNIPGSRGAPAKGTLQVETLGFLFEDLTSGKRIVFRLDDGWPAVFLLAAELIGKIPLKEASPEVFQAVRALHQWIEAKEGSPSPSLSRPLTLEDMAATSRGSEAQGQGKATEDLSCPYCGKNRTLPGACCEDLALD